MAAVFLISLYASNSHVEKEIKEAYPGTASYKYNSTVYFVLDDCLAEEVAEKVRIKGDNRFNSSSGVVIKLNLFTYSGYTTRSLWDWLADAEKRT